MKTLIAALIAASFAVAAVPAAQAYSPGIVAAHYSGHHVDTRDKWQHKCRFWRLYYHHKICRQYW